MAFWEEIRRIQTMVRSGEKNLIASNHYFLQAPIRLAKNNGWKQ